MNVTKECTEGRVITFDRLKDVMECLLEVYREVPELFRNESNG